jgi:internalin A
MLFDNNITDISPLRNLVNLRELDLSENEISNLTPLENLVNLEKLNLCYNNIIDISPLENLINLKELDLVMNPASVSHQIDELRRRLPGCIITEYKEH